MQNSFFVMDFSEQYLTPKRTSTYNSPVLAGLLNVTSRRAPDNAKLTVTQTASLLSKTEYPKTLSPVLDK